MISDADKEYLKVEKLRDEYESSLKDEFYRGWLNDNMDRLKDEFVEDHNDEFIAFCKVDFKDYLSDKTRWG